MTRLTIVGLIAGLSLALVLTLSSGLGEVGDALAKSGPGVVLVVIARALAVATAGAGWFALFPPSSRPRLRLCVLVRFVREATNGLLPLAQIGGDLIGARLLTFFRVPGALAGASVVVDVLIQAATQSTFVLIGLAVLLALGADPAIARTVGIGLLLAASALGAFYLVQRRSGERLLRAVLARFARSGRAAALGTAEAVFDRLRLFHSEPRRLARSFAVHLAGWMFGVLEVYAGLAVLGHPVTWGEALVIESLTQAIRGAAFAVPGAIGVQEGGLMALCAVFGVPAQTAVALALLKRAADLMIGVPGLLVWQALEGRTLLRARPAAADRHNSAAEALALSGPPSPRAPRLLAGEHLLGG